MLFCDMRSGKLNSPLMAQLLSVLTNITQVRLEKVMARATTKCTVNEQKNDPLHYDPSSLIFERSKFMLF